MQLSIADRFAAELEFLKQDQSDAKLGIAVSGGGDSMALLYLAHVWAQANGFALHAVTVDHGLRDGSADEAAMVARVCGDLAISHAVLAWEDWQGQGNLQMAAREARRAMIAGWADGRGIGRVLLGHTADDQAETVLMRLARGSGVDGLAGMRSEGMFLRPLLGCARAELRDFLRGHGINWVDDPSNEDARFDRIKARQMMGHLAQLGLTRERLVQTAQHMQMARTSLNDAMRQLAAKSVAQEAGDLVLGPDVYRDLCTDHQARLLAACLQWVGGGAYRPRYEALRALSQTCGRQTTTTLAGCLIQSTARNIRIGRESQAVAELACDPSEIWDNRWRIDGPGRGDAVVRALGEAGLQHCADWRDAGLPRTSLLASPAVWRGDALLAAPLAGLGNGWTATITTDFHQWLVSH